MNNVLSFLGLALRGGRLAVGDEAASLAVRAGEARLLLLASDAGASTVRRVQRLAEESRCLLAVLPAGREALGQALGRGSAAVAALTDLGMAAALAQRLAAQEPERYGETAERMERKLQRAAERRSAPHRPPPESPRQQARPRRPAPDRRAEKRPRPEAPFRRGHADTSGPGASGSPKREGSGRQGRTWEKGRSASGRYNASAGRPTQGSDPRRGKSRGGRPETQGPPCRPKQNRPSVNRQGPKPGGAPFKGRPSRRPAPGQKPPDRSGRS